MPHISVLSIVVTPGKDDDKKVQPEHVHVDGVVCPLCEMHGDILDPGLPDEEFEGVLPLSGGGAPFP
jgi:hypothetical protein